MKVYFMRKILSSILCILLLLSMVVLPVGADEATTVTHIISEEVEYLDNGYYIVTTVTETYNLTSARDAVQSKTGSKTRTVLSGAKVELYSITVTGTFTYNGAYSKATGSSYSYAILLPSVWSFVSGSATYSDNIATATGIFKSTITGNSTTSVTVSCSEDGTIY